MRRRLTSLLALCALSVACGGAPTARDKGRPIDTLRERASAAPNDKNLWLELAVAEHLADGGDEKRAREAIAHARKIGVSSIRLTFIEAEQHVLEARPQQALEAYLQLLAQAPSSSDPLTPWLSEAAFSALIDMNDAVDDYRTRVRGALTALEPHKAKLGLTSLHALAMQNVAHAIFDGDMARAQTIAQNAGCVQRAQVAGPFGPRELIGFDRQWPAEKPGPLADKHDLGPGRGVQPTRTLETRRCVLSLGRGAHDALAGTSIVRVELTAASAGMHALRIESPNSFVVWLDGKELARSDLRKEPPFGVRYLPVELSRGHARAQAQGQLAPPQPGAVAEPAARRSVGTRAHTPARPLRRARPLPGQQALALARRCRHGPRAAAHQRPEGAQRALAGAGGRGQPRRPAAQPGAAPRPRARPAAQSREGERSGLVPRRGPGQPRGRRGAHQGSHRRPARRSPALPRGHRHRDHALRAPAPARLRRGGRPRARPAAQAAAARLCGARSVSGQRARTRTYGRSRAAGARTARVRRQLQCALCLAQGAAQV